MNDEKNKLEEAEIVLKTCIGCSYLIISISIFIFVISTLFK